MTTNSFIEVTENTVKTVQDHAEIIKKEVVEVSVVDVHADVAAEEEGEEGEEEELFPQTNDSPNKEKEKRRLRNIKRKERRMKLKQSLSEEVIDDTNKPNNSRKSESSTPEPITNPFAVKLRSVSLSTNKKYSEILSEILPIKTIIGITHQQILNADLSDVKIKTLISSSSISKYAATGVKFTTAHTEDLFGNEETKRIFLCLCLNVALFESIGFRRTRKQYPNILELFGGYDEINLETTRTKLTPSNKAIHQNNLDYSVLAYLGHILIWAANQQRQAGVAIFTEKFDLELTQEMVKAHIGGYHLWDRLRREAKGMNSKRWKHIIKFRTSFPYEEDQFMIILRFMKISDNIP